MRPLFAHLALAAVLTCVLSPLAVALQSRETPPCCLPGGKHHCRETPTGPGLNRQSERCPYASVQVAITVKAGRAPKFQLVGSAIFGYLGSVAIESAYRATLQESFSRGPPNSSL